VVERTPLTQSRIQPYTQQDCRLSPSPAGQQKASCSGTYANSGLPKRPSDLAPRSAAEAELLCLPRGRGIPENNLRASDEDRFNGA
jgi:hypothetical protein